MARSSRRHQNRTRRQPELLLPVVRGHGTLRFQVESALRQAVRAGRLSSNGALPSSRVLARDLGVSRGVVVAAYEQLIAEGFLIGRPRSQTVAAPQMKRVEWRVERDAATRLQDFKPGVPDVREFPHREWSRATRTALKAVTDRDLGYGDVRGSHLLRARLAEYLGRSRAVDTGPAQLLICTGVTQALGIAVRALIAAGIRCIAVEDPAQPEIRQLVAEAGASVVEIRVDGQGVVVADLANTRAGAIIVTPAHQFPTGCILSAERRHELMAWARGRRGFIVEDDYDAEYRYDGMPVGAMQGLAPDRVVYTGSVSKTLAPGLRLGWMCLPPDLLTAAVAAKKLADLGSPSLDQLVFAEFMAMGALDSHLRRMRRVYRARRDTLVRILTDRKSWRVEGIAAGLHLVATLGSGTEESHVLKSARTQGVLFHAMSEYRRRRARTAKPALVLGYGQFTEREIEKGLQRGFA